MARSAASRLAEEKSKADVTHTHVVKKAFMAGGTMHRPGESVDASNWRNRDKMERYIRPIMPGEFDPQPQFVSVEVVK